MTSSGPGDDVTLDDIVARVRELPSRLRSLYVETYGSTDSALGENASSRVEGVLVAPRPIDATGAVRHQGWHVRSWIVFDPEQWEPPRYAVIGVLPRRCREEIVYTDRDGTIETSVSGADDTASWWAKDGGFERTDSRKRIGNLYNFWVVGRQWIDDRVGRELVSDEVEILGSRCARVRITPPGGLWAPGRLRSGDEHLLDVDIETGMTLALTSLHDDEVFQHYEVIALELDPEIDAVLTAPPGGAVAIPESTSYRDISEIAADAGGLAVFAPSRLPEGYRFRTGAAQLDRDGEMRVSVTYQIDAMPATSLHLTEFPVSPRPRPEPDGWTWVDRGERAVVISDVTGAEGVRLAEAWIRGTGIMMSARLSAAELLDVAFSLEAVRA